MDKNNPLSSQDVSLLIDHLMKSRDPATVGLKRIFKRKQDDADRFPLHPMSYDEFCVPGKTGDALSPEEKRVLLLEKKVKELERALADADEKNKAALVTSREAGMREGIAKGEREGGKKAKADFDMQISLLQTKIASFLETLEKSKKKIYADSHDVLLKLSFELTKKIVHAECVTNPDVVLNVIKKSISYIADREKIIVRVAKDDFENASANKDFWLPVGERIESVRVECDERIDKGGCIVESNSGIADARLNVQMEELKNLVDTLWQGVLSGSDS
jgi:flagellar assembly protein FliH